MKRWQILTLGAIVVVGLSVRGIMKLIDRDDKRRDWYKANLHYNFSAKVDSIGMRGNVERGIGLIYISADMRKFRRSVEDSLNKKLEGKGDVRFITRRDGKLNFFSFNAKLYMSGDSLAINSDENKIAIYRDAKLTGTDSLILRGDD